MVCFSRSSTSASYWLTCESLVVFSACVVSCVSWGGRGVSQVHSSLSLVSWLLFCGFLSLSLSL